MNKFLPLTGGHSFRLDDLMMMENSYLDGFNALLRIFSGTGSCILDGIIVTIGSITVTYTSGYVAVNGEIYQVAAGSFAKSSNPADILYFKPIQTVITPSPVTYEDTGSKNVHFQRVAILKYKQVGDTDGEEYFKCLRSDAGEIRDWLPPTGTLVSDFFDATGLGINVKKGWAICNGLNGTPDFRGFYTAEGTDVLASGAGALNAALNGLTPHIGDTFGVNQVTLTQANLPNVSFSVTDPGHHHDLPADASGISNIQSISDTPNADEGFNGGHQTATATTGITVNSGGSGTAVENRPPTKYVYKIMRLN